MDEHVERAELRADRLLDLVADRVHAQEVHIAVEEDVHIEQLVRAGLARAQAVPAPDLRHMVENRADGRLLLRREARVRELRRRLDDHAPARAEDDARDEDGNDRVEPRPARDLHEHEAREHADRRPDIRREMQPVRLERLRARELRDADETARDDEIDDDGDNHDDDAVLEELRRLGPVELIHRLVDDADGRADDEQRLHRGREILILPVAVVMLFVRRQLGLMHGPERDERRDEIRARVQRLGDEAHGADVQADDELQYHKCRIGKNGQPSCPLLELSQVLHKDPS